MKLLFGDRFDGSKFVNPGIVDENIETAEIFDGGVNKALSVGGFGYIAGNGDGLATGGSDGGDNLVRSGFTGGVIYDYGSAFSGERLGDGGSDAFGSSGDDGYFIFQFAHVNFLSKICVEWCDEDCSGAA
jgi:hypothetical protein